MCAGARVQSPIPSPATHYHRIVQGPKTESDRKEQLEGNTCESTTAFIYWSSSIIRQNQMVCIHIYNTSETFQSFDLHGQ